MFTRLKSSLRRFRRDEEGSFVAEAAIMFPTLFAAVLATFVFFDAFRNQSMSLKAAYTVSEAFSRQEFYINNTYMVNAWNLHRFLTNSASLTKLRVSVIQYDANSQTHSVVWSENKGGAGVLDDSLLEVMVNNDEIPVMPHLEALIVVQTWVDYEPNFSIGLDAFTFQNTVFTRPRFAPNGICYTTSTSGVFGPDNSSCPIQS